MNYSHSRFEFQGWLLIVVGILGALLWAALYPLDQGVMASGFLIPKTEKITIISPTTGLVSSMNHKNGDHVEIGELLLDFDSQVLMANKRSIRQSIAGVELSNISLRNAFKARMQQVQSLELQKESTHKLVQSGFASATALASNQAQLSLAESDANEMKSRIEQNTSRAIELRESEASLERQIQQQKIHSPVAGQIMNLGVKSSGVNLVVGSPILEIVPDSDQLVIETRIPLDFSNQVHVGMAVDIMFPTLPGSSTLHLRGELVYISADKVFDPRSNQPYIEGRVSLPAMQTELEKQLRAGLPATMVILSGKRTLLSYITRPVTERVSRGLH